MANKSTAKIWAKHFFSTIEENRKSLTNSSFPKTLDDASKTKQAVTIYGVIATILKVSLTKL